MTVASALVRLYPPGIRARWGGDIEGEATAIGPRAWFDTAVAAGKLWLHPSDWPETSVGQTRRVLATVVVAVLAVVVMLLRATGPSSITANAGHLAGAAWLVPILVGLALATPLPPLGRVAVARLITVVVRTVVAPVAAFAVLVVIAHSGLISHPTGVGHALLVGYYWATVGFVGLHLCVLTVRVARVAVLPSTRRLRHGLVLVGLGLTLAAAQTVPTAVEFGSVVRTGGLAALAAVVLAAAVDLRRIRPGGAPPTTISQP